MTKPIGILALQGCIEHHARHLESLGADFRLVKLPKDLDGISGLILPGGESTTMIKIAKAFDLWEPLKAKAAEIPYWGICAGSILMGREVENPVQESLAVIDVKVRRNAYGRQIDSFQKDVVLGDGSVEGAVFIRAPKFVSWGANVKVEGKIDGESSFLSQGRHMITAFHPELTASHWCHKLFLERVKRG